MKRGSIYWINLEPASPPEFGKIRPGIIVSHSVYNERLESLVVVPLSSRAPEIWPLRLEIKIGGSKPSYAIIPGIRQVSRARLHDFIGQTPTAAVARIGDALAVYLGE